MWISLSKKEHKKLWPEKSLTELKTRESTESNPLVKIRLIQSTTTSSNPRSILKSSFIPLCNLTLHIAGEVFSLHKRVAPTLSSSPCGNKTKHDLCNMIWWWRSYVIWIQSMTSQFLLSNSWRKKTKWIQPKSIWRFET